MFFKAKKIISFLFLTTILSSVLFLLPIESTKINIAQAAEPAVTATTPSEPTTPNTVKTGGCDILSGTGVLSCVLDVEYGLIVGLTSNLFILSGQVFDTLWAFGLSSDSYKQDEFIGAGWIVCRDIANTFFIFILLYIAITTILQMGDNKKLLSTIVVVALLMNFSLYITRFVIDIGNMFALEFYSTFPADPNPAVTIPGIERHTIAGGYYNALISPLVNITQNLPGSNGAITNFGLAAASIAFVGIEFLIVSFVFLIASFLLVGRLATLWILMILSPLAFFSRALPSGVSGASGLWGKWTSQLISQTFFPAIFLFFMYFAARLSNGSSYVLTTFAPQSGDTIMVFIPLVIRFGIIIAFIMYGLKTATEMSGKAGGMAAKWGGAAVLGGAAIAGRQIGGRFANYARLSKEEGGLGLGQSLTKTGMGRLALSGLNKVAEGSFDARATSLGGKVIAGSGASLGQAGGQGGYAKEVQEAERKNKAIFDSLKNDPKAQAKMVANMQKLGEGMININGVQQRVRTNPDRDVKKLMAGLPVRERMKLIENAEGKDKEYLSRIQKEISEVSPELKQIEEAKSEYDHLKDQPKAQADYILNLHTSGRQEMIAPLMGKLTAKERYNAISGASGDTRAYLEQVNKDVMEKMKPDQKGKDEKEWKEAENFGSFKTSLKDYRESKKLKEEAEKSGDIAQKEIHEKAMKEHSEKVEKNLKQLGVEQVKDLKYDDLIEEPIVQNLSSEHYKAIQKKSGSTLTLEQETEFKRIIKEKSRQEAVRDAADLALANEAKEKKTEEKVIYTPSGSLSDEIRKARSA